MYRFRLFGMVCILLVSALPTFAQVVPDGQTATTVNTAPNGHVTVNIALPFTGVTGDISHNSYHDFNVLKPGVTLDNTIADARMIVNEVTGVNPSLITGILDVSGPKAHVILANPNGITVNGGKFVNTGGVILSTGQISYIDRDITPITTQRNALLTTNKGVIRVEGDGLAGVFSNLELIAKRVEVDAAITNSQTETLARVRLAGGSGITEVDSSVSVVDITNDWTSLTPDAVTEECPNAICVNLTGRGSVSSSKIEVAVTDAGAGVRLAGNMAAKASDMVLVSNGDIIVTGTLEAERNQVISTPGTLYVKKEGEMKAGGVVAVNAGHTLVEDNGLLVGASVTIEGQKLTMQATEKGTPQIIAIGGGVNIEPSESVSVKGGVIYADDAVIIRSRNIETEAVKRQGEWKSAAITSAASGVVIETSIGGSLVNGGIIQGTKRIADMAESEGAVTLRSDTYVENRSGHADAPALIFGAEDDVVIRSSGNINNYSGQILSNTKVNLYSGGEIRNEVQKTFNPNDGHYEEYAYKASSVFFKKTKVNGRRVEFGELLVPGGGAFITAKDAVVLQAAGAIHNIGGEIYATDGGISLIASHLQNGILQAGSAFVETRCHWFCREVGSSNLTAQGGIIRALNHVTVNTETMTSKGGVVQSTDGNINLYVPGQVTLEAVPIYTYMDVDRGLFQGNLLRLLRHDQGGSLIANRGRITINSPYSVTVNGGIVEAEEVVAPNGIDIVRTPNQEEPVFPTDNLGLLGGVL